MQLQPLIQQYKPLLIQQYARLISANQWQALHALQRCRTRDSGELQVQCTQCEQRQWHPLSCGHRSCPVCQNHEVTQWLDRQKKKQLPMDYFMATFTSTLR